MAGKLFPECQCVPLVVGIHGMVYCSTSNENRQLRGRKCPWLPSTESTPPWRPKSHWQSQFFVRLDQMQRNSYRRNSVAISDSWYTYGMREDENVLNIPRRNYQVDKMLRQKWWSSRSHCHPRYLVASLWVHSWRFAASPSNPEVPCPPELSPAGCAMLTCSQPIF